jgi:hypothetical protein
MKELKDTRYWLSSFFDEQEQSKHEFSVIKKQIDVNGSFNIKSKEKSIKIYTPELALILSSTELNARNLDTKEDTAINGWEYFKTYEEAYKEGEEYFDREFKVSPDTLYGNNAEHYVKDIHMNFFHAQCGGIKQGWSYVKKQYPIVLTHKAVKELGYYSGIVNRVEEQVKKYPQLFATFDQCEHKLPPTERETATFEIKPSLKPESVQVVFDILKDFFATDDQDELKMILETGNNSSKKLLFKGNGNRLTDAFKKLIENDFIVGFQKKDLIQWIISNFNYIHRKTIKGYTPDTVEKIISRNDNPCKHPLIKVIDGQIKKA